jgi:peptide/nickel transport system permease protein
MARTQAPTVAAEAGTGAVRLTKKKSQLRIAWGRFYRDKMALLGSTIIVTITLMAIFAPYLSPYNPYEMDITKRLRPPGTPGYLLGADESGRDIFSRLL